MPDLKRERFFIDSDFNVKYAPNFTKSDDSGDIKSIFDENLDLTIPTVFLIEQVKNLGYMDFTETDAENLKNIKEYGDGRDISIEYYKSIYNEIYSKYNKTLIIGKKRVSILSDKKLDNMLDKTSFKFLIIEYTVKISTNGKSLDLQDIFDTIKLSENIPMVGFSKIIKVFKQKVPREDEIFNKVQDLNLSKNGLTLKVKIIEKSAIPRYAIIVLSANGYMNFKADFTPNCIRDTEIEHLVISTIEGILLRDTISIETLNLEKYTASINVYPRIERGLFSELVDEDATNIFLLKDNISQLITTVVDLYTKRIVNIKENIKDSHESTITIRSCKTIPEFREILKRILTVNTLIEPQDMGKRVKIKQSNIKKLKQLGVYNNPKASGKCQKARQIKPLEDDDIPITYSVTIDGQKYHCPTAQYPFPGYRPKDGIPCCYGTDQRGKTEFKGTGELIIFPSNYKTRVNEKGDIKKLLKGEDGDYYYLNGKELVKITDSEALLEINTFINSMEKGKTIFLPKTTLSYLFDKGEYEGVDIAPDNDCILHPDDNGNCNGTGVHFGFTKKSFACCFKREPTTMIPVPPRITRIITKNYISSNQILEDNKLGHVPKVFSKIFNETYLRLGVEQGKSAFLNCIVASNYEKLENASELRLKLNAFINRENLSGELLIKYNSIENFSKVLLDSNASLPWEEIIEPLQIMLEHCIIVLDNSNNIPKILCSKIIPHDRTILVVHNPINFINLKNQNTFELIIRNGNGTLYNTHNSESKAIKALLNYSKEGCKIEKNAPRSFPFDDNFTVKDLEERFPDLFVKRIDSGHFNITHLLTVNNSLIPVQESKEINDTDQDLYELLKKIQKTDLADLETTISDFETVGLHVKAVTVNSKGLIDSVLSNTGVYSPIKSTIKANNFTMFPILPNKYYYKIDYYLNPTLEHPTKNEQYDYSRKVDLLYTRIQDISQELYSQLDSDIRADIEIVQKMGIPRKEKVQDIVEILENILETTGGDSGRDVDFILRYIATGITNDNTFMEGKALVSRKFIKRDTEAIITSYEDYIHLK